MNDVNLDALYLFAKMTLAICLFVGLGIGVKETYREYKKQRDAE